MCGAVSRVPISNEELGIQVREMAECELLAGPDLVGGSESVLSGQRHTQRMRPQGWV